MYTGVDNQGDGGGMFSMFSSFFGGSGDKAAKKESTEPSLAGLEDVPRGVYMYGGVGCGKSLLMDTFFDCAPIDPAKKRRVHFHEFMLEVHQRMHRLRQDQPDIGDPLPYIAHDISTSSVLLCFDEFQV
jgi:protein AFG1